MRVVFGPPPDAMDFSPAEEGWRKLREPEPGDFLLAGAVVGTLSCVLLAIAWKHSGPASATARSALDALDPTNINYRNVALLLAGTGCFVALVIVHELLHALALPRFGMTRESYVGFWPRWLMPYAAHTGTIRCRRFILVLLAPFLVLSVAPLVLALATGATSQFCVMMSMVNAFLSGGDVLMSFVVATRVPKNAWLRTKGWHTWWQAA